MGVLALGLSAAGKRDEPDLSLRIRDETAPPGAIVQMKVRTTEVEPISGGRPRLTVDAFDLAGIGMFAPTGELAGAAVIEGNHVSLAYVTTTPVTGEYPLLTVALRVRPDTPVGSRIPFTLDPSSLWNLKGTAVPARVSPGMVTVGGSLAIDDVIPGQGEWPAGTVVTVRGVGFDALARLRIGNISIAAVRVVSSTEIQCMLGEAANMTGAAVRVDNPDGSRSTYFSYVRGIPAATSGRTLLATTYPIFSGTTRSLATFDAFPAMSSTTYAALALQNPGLASAGVIVGVYATDGTLIYASGRSLESGHRLALELSELLDGVIPPSGASVRVISSAPIQVFGLVCDEAEWTVTPQLPAEASFEV